MSGTETRGDTRTPKPTPTPMPMPVPMHMHMPVPVPMHMHMHMHMEQRFAGRALHTRVHACVCGVGAHVRVVDECIVGLVSQRRVRVGRGAPRWWCP